MRVSSVVGISVVNMKTLENIVSDQRIERLAEGRAQKLLQLLGSSAVEMFKQYGLDELHTDEAAAISGMLYGEPALRSCENRYHMESPDEIMRTRIILTEQRDDATPRDRALYSIYRQLRSQYGSTLRTRQDD